MSEDTVAVPAVQPATTPKKKTKGAAKKAKSAPTHPKVSEMVIEAITTLKERGGSSLQAIKKHVSAHNKVDMDRLTPFIKKFLKSAVASGTLVQTKGKGATGSFKLGSSAGQKAKEPKKQQAKKPKKESAAAKKKAATPKKAAKPKVAKADKKKKPAAKKSPVKKAAKPKSPKKVAKPKAKKATSPKKAASKKTPKK